MADLDPGEIAELVKWLHKRAEPDSGIRYEGASFDQESGTREQSRVVLHGSDADFIAEHFHGKGAAVLASALTALERVEAAKGRAESMRVALEDMASIGATIREGNMMLDNEPPLFVAGYELACREITASIRARLAGDALAASPPSPAVAPVAFRFELSHAVDTTKALDDPTRYVDWGPEQLSFAEPQVPEGAVRNLIPLYASPVREDEGRDAVLEAAKSAAPDP